MMAILGYIASFFIGVSLGLLGAGGSILTVPVMVYLFHVPVLEATSYSLFIVGVTSLLGACYQYKQENVQGKVAMLFGMVSLLVVSLIRKIVLPNIPSTLFVISGVNVTFSIISMLLFAIVMMLAAYAMIRRRKLEDEKRPSDRCTIRLVLCGVLVGSVTGFLGAGGGFFLIPSLVLLLGLPMKKAIGTSLLIIAINSIVGFSMDLQHVTIDWLLLGGVTLIAATGIYFGFMAGRKIPVAKLKVVFGWFVLLIGIMILVKELSSFLYQLPHGHI
jgi:uncharacterized membrane protein YfcA